MSEGQAQKIKWLKVAEYFEFARWTATPSIMKNPRTQGDFSLLHNVSHQTLARWKNDPDFWEDVRRYEDEWARGYGADVKASIIAQAIRGNTEAQKIFMTHYQGYTTKHNSETKDTKKLEIGPNLTAVLMERARQRKELANKDKEDGSGSSNN